MRLELQDVHYDDDDDDDMSPLTRVAACAALLVYKKYFKVMEESEMCHIAIGEYFPHVDGVHHTDYQINSIVPDA
jgi:hypothetical protein